MKKKWLFRDENNKNRFLMRAYAKAHKLGATDQIEKQWYIDYINEYQNFFDQIATFPLAGKMIEGTTEFYRVKGSGKDSGAIIKYEIIPSDEMVLIFCPEDWI